LKNAYKILLQKSEGKKPPWRPTCKWEYNIKMGLKGTGYEGAD
jgi:hypothetical protein